MSATQSSLGAFSSRSDDSGHDDGDAEPTYECDHCQTATAVSALVAGSYCSSDCYYRAKGARLLSKIKSDHRFCATCFKQLKEIDRPPEQWIDDHMSLIETALDHGASFSNQGGELVLDYTDCDADTNRTAADAVTGFESHTEHGDQASVRREAEPDTRIYEHDHQWGCVCGNIDSHRRDEILERVEREEVVVDLWTTLHTLSRDGVIEQRPDRDRLFEALRNHWRDWEYAIGRAVYD